MMKLTEKDFKTAIITIHRGLKGKMNIDNRQYWAMIHETMETNKVYPTVSLNLCLDTYIMVPKEGTQAQDYSLTKMRSRDQSLERLRKLFFVGQSTGGKELRRKRTPEICIGLSRNTKDTVFLPVHR